MNDDYKRALHVARELTNNEEVQKGLADLLSEDEFSMSEAVNLTYGPLRPSGNPQTKLIFFVNEDSSAILGLKHSGGIQMSQKGVYRLDLLLETSPDRVRKLKSKLDPSKRINESMPLSSTAMKNLGETLMLYNKIQKEGLYKV